MRPVTATQAPGQEFWAAAHPAWGGGMQVEVDTVRYLLAHLYDNAALASSPLAAVLGGQEADDASYRAESLRRVMLDSIQFLRPARSDSLKSLAARSYAVLWLRYAQGMTVGRVAEELALGERQTFRELRLAEAKLAEIVSERLEKTQKEAARDRRAPALEEQVTTKPVVVDVRKATLSALQTVRPLAQSVGVTLAATLENAGGEAFVDEGILRQLLIQSLSLGIQHGAGRKVVLRGEREAAGINLRIEFASGARGVDQTLVGPLRSLANTLGVSIEVNEGAAESSLSVHVPLRRPRDILVVEDSRAAVQLYRRFLEPSGMWRVIAPPEPHLACDTARSLQPALVILDILMPSTDGWTILNLLHAHKDTADIPVIVCSVFHDALLAKSLGAKAHLTKPISQAQLLAAVRTWAR